MGFQAAGTMRHVGKLASLALAAALCTTGCEITVEPPTTKPPPEIKIPAAQAALVGLGAKLEKQQTEAAAKPSAGDQQFAEHRAAEHRAAELSPTVEAKPIDARPRPRRDELLLAANDQPGGERSPDSNGGKFDVPQAVEQIIAEIRDATELRKTLVVLIVEQTSAANSLVEKAAEQFDQKLRELETSQQRRLEVAVIGYSDDVNMVIPEPTSDASQISVGLSAVKQTQGDKANLFAAVNRAVEKFLPYRLHGYELIFVVVGSSPGDDLNLADPAIKALKKSAVPVYGVGPAVVFGAPRYKLRRAGAAGTGDSGSRPTESLFPERIQLSLSGNQNTVDLNDSGYGPFGAERLCRQTEGKFFRLHAARPQGWAVDMDNGDIKSELNSKYAPDYVDEAHYQHLLEENKCRLALHNASLLPPAEGLGQVTTDFPKQQDEAALAKMITNAQKAAAIDDQPLQRLYDALVAGEADRPKLTGARWQAGYDLALGEVLAAKARLDGYNAILAIIKQGKAFTNADSTKWVLEPANENAAGSVLDKMTKKSRAYLQRVVDEHPGTPWAAVAQRELKFPAGWKLVEK
jgi:Mg-chelatase subunit ChlD